MIGASFQPGLDERERMQGQPGARPNAGGGVQEAIKVLSLRLPKVVGAQAVSPQALLSSQGSRGNRSVDSIVESVLQQMFPSGGAAQTPVPSPVPAETSSPSPVQFSGTASGPMATKERTADHPDWLGNSPIPNIIVGTPPPGTPPLPPMPFGNPTSGTDADLSGGGGPRPGMIATPTPAPPDLRRNFDWLPSPPQEPMPLL